MSSEDSTVQGCDVLILMCCVQVLVPLIPRDLRCTMPVLVVSRSVHAPHTCLVPGIWYSIFPLLWCMNIYFMLLNLPFALHYILHVV
jgi:hypothetical protein